MITVSNTANGQSFGTVATRLNQIAAIITSNVVTTDSSSGGSITTGNGYVNGFFGVVTLYANAINGGNLTSSANLNLTSNTIVYNGVTPILSILSNTTAANIALNSNTLTLQNNVTVYGNNITFPNNVIFNGNLSANNLSAISFSLTTLTIGINIINTLAIAVGSNVILGSSGLNVGNSTVNSFVNSIALNLNQQTISVNGSNIVVNTTYLNIGTNLNINSSSIIVNGVSGSLLSQNSTLINIGNSTVNASVNSTLFSGTSNNANYLGGVPAASYVTTSGSATINVGANVSLNTSALFIGNSTVNSFINSSSALLGPNVNIIQGNINIFSNVIVNGVINTVVNTSLNSNSLTINFWNGNSTVNVYSSAILNSNTLTLGNTTVNAILNSTALNIGGTVINASGVSGTTATANNSNYLGGNPPSYYANVTSPLFSANISVGANVYLNTSSLFIGNSTVNNVINSTLILLGNSTVNASVNSTTFSGTALLANNSTYLNGQLSSYYANVSAPVFTTTINVGSNVSLNTSVLFIGNSTVNSTVNSTIFSGTALLANNSTNFGGQAPSYYANITSPIFTTTVNVEANVSLNTSTLFIGNSTVNAIHNSTIILLGNSTVNSSVNSTIFTGTSNNSTNFNGQAPSYYANVSAPVFTTTVNVGANVSLNTSTLFIGNSTVNLVINSSSISGGSLTVNNTNYFGGQAPSYYANVSAPIFTTTVNVGANVSLNTSGLFIGNSTVNTFSNSTTLSYNGTVVLNSTAFTGTANNSTNFAGQGQGFYANVSAPVFTTTINVGANVTLNTSCLSIGNSTVNLIINSSAVSGGSLTVNNTNYFGGQAPSYYANITSPIFTTFANVGANVSLNTSTLFIGNSTVNTIVNSTTLSYNGIVVLNSTTFTGTANNSTNFAGQGQAFYANVSAPIFTTTVNVGANVSLNTSGLFIGNSTVNSFVNSTIFSGTSNNSTNFNGHGQAFYANVSAPVFTTTVNVGINVSINTTSLSISNSIVNTTIGNNYINIGANVSLNSSSLFIGNSTVNSTVNSSTFYTQFNQHTSLIGINSGFSQWINLGTITGATGSVARIAIQGAQNMNGLDSQTGSDIIELRFANGLISTTVPNINGRYYRIGGANNLITNVALQSVNGIARDNAYNVIVQINNGCGDSALYVDTDSSSTWTANLALSGGSPGATSNTVIYLNNTWEVQTQNLIINSISMFVGSISVGNSSVNGVVNSTTFTGTANNSLYLGSTLASSYQLNSTLSANVATMTANNSSNFNGQAASFYANVSAPVFTTTVNVGSNVSLNTSVLFIGNSTVNSIHNSTTISFGSATINSLTYSGTSNNSSNFNGQAASFYANVSAPVFTTSVNVGSNVNITTSQIQVGNSTVNTVIGNNTIFLGNSTVNVTINSSVANINGIISGSTNYGNNVINAISGSGTAIYAQSNSGLAGFFIANTNSSIAAFSAGGTQNTLVINTTSMNLVTNAGVDASIQGINHLFTISNVTISAAHTYIAAQIYANNNSLNSNSTAGILASIVQGLFLTSNNSGNATIGSIYGINQQSGNFSSYLGQSIVTSFGISSVYTVGNTSNSGTVYGFYSRIGHASNTITGLISNAYGYYSQIGAFTNAASIGNSYLFYGSMYPNANITGTAYGLYVTGENTNFISSSLTIGSNVSLNTSSISVGNSTVNTFSNSSVIKINGVPLAVTGWNNLYSFSLASYGTNTAPGATAAGSSLTVYNSNSTITHTLTGTWTFCGGGAVSSNVGLWVRTV